MLWPKAALLSLEWLWLGLGVFCLGLSAALAARPRAVGRLESALKKADPRVLAALGLGFPALVALMKLAQLRTYQLMWDSGVMGNLAWNAAHGYGLLSSVIGDQSYLSVHFAFTMALISPVLWLWNSVAPLALLQGLAVASSIPCIYLLAKTETDDALAPWLAALLAMGGPFFKGIACAVIDNSVYALPFFLWAAYFWKKGRRGLAAALGVLLLTTREQVPFLFFGLGLYLLVRDRRPREPTLALLVVDHLPQF